MGDLLSHYPRRYARRGELSGLTDLPLDENVTIVAEVLEVRERSMKARRGSILEARISDGTGILTLTFFNQAWRSKDLKLGARGIFAGKVGDYRGTLQLAHPDYELFEADDSRGPEAAKAWAEVPIPHLPGHIDCGVLAGGEGDRDRARHPAAPAGPGAGCRAARAIADGLRAGARARCTARRRTPDWGAARKSLKFQEAFVLQAALSGAARAAAAAECHGADAAAGRVARAVRCDAAIHPHR